MADTESGARADEDVESGDSMSPSVGYRPLVLDDIPELRELQRTLFPVQYGDSFYTKLLSPGYYCLVGVTAAGELVAVASARVIRPEEANETQAAHEAYIMTLGVKESYRRHHLGTEIMELILQLLRRETACDYATLHVKSINAAAVGFYERMGFTCDPMDGFLENHYYIDGQHWHAYRYTRSLRHPLYAFVRDLRASCSVL